MTGDAGKTLCKKRERWFRVCQSADIGLWDLDLVSQKVWRTPTLDRVFGYDTPQPEWTCERLLEHVVPEG